MTQLAGDNVSEPVGWFGAQLVSFQVVPAAQLAVAVLVASTVVSSRSWKMVCGYATYTVKSERLALVSRTLCTNWLASKRLGLPALLVLHVAATVQVL